MVVTCNEKLRVQSSPQFVTLVSMVGHSDTPITSPLPPSPHSANSSQDGSIFLLNKQTNQGTDMLWIEERLAKLRRASDTELTVKGCSLGKPIYERGHTLAGCSMPVFECVGQSLFTHHQFTTRLQVLSRHR